MPHQMETTNKKIEVIKMNQIEIIELKIPITEIKKLLKLCPFY